MPTIIEDKTGAESELAFTLRNHKGHLALAIGGQTVTPQVPPKQALKQAARWAAKVALRYTSQNKTTVDSVGEVELRGYGNGVAAAALGEVFSKAKLRVSDPTPCITDKVISAFASGALTVPPEGAFRTRTPWDQTTETARMLHTVPNSVTLLHPNYANIAMYDGANGEAAIRALKGDELLSNPPERRVFSNRTLGLLKAIAGGAKVGLAQDLGQVYGGRPFVVVAPGEACNPTEVKRLQEGGAVVLASWQAVEKLNAGGVVPNLAVCLDPSSLLITKYKGGKAEALLCDTMAVQDFWNMGMPVYLFNVRSAHLHQNLWSHFNWFTLADQSQTVSEASVWLAMLLGASSMVVMGADYACRLPEAQAKAIGNHIPCVGVEDGRQWFTQWHYWGACRHMLQLAMALTHGKLAIDKRAPEGGPFAYFVTGGLFSHLAKLWGLVLPIMQSAESLGVSASGSKAPVCPAPTPMAEAYPEAAAKCKELLRVAATTTPTCFADKSVLSKSLHADFSNPNSAELQALLQGL